MLKLKPLASCVLFGLPEFFEFGLDIFLNSAFARFLRLLIVVVVIFSLGGLVVVDDEVCTRVIFTCMMLLAGLPLNRHLLNCAHATPASAL